MIAFRCSSLWMAALLLLARNALAFTPFTRLRHVLDEVIAPNLQEPPATHLARIEMWAGAMRAEIEARFKPDSLEHPEELSWILILYQPSLVREQLREHPLDSWIKDAGVCDVDEPPESCRTTGGAMTFSYSWVPGTPGYVDRKGNSVKGALAYLPLPRTFYDRIRKAVVYQTVLAVPISKAFRACIPKHFWQRSERPRQQIVPTATLAHIAQCVAGKLQSDEALQIGSPGSPKAVFGHSFEVKFHANDGGVGIQDFTQGIIAEVGSVHLLVVP